MTCSELCGRNTADQEHRPMCVPSWDPRHVGPYGEDSPRSPHTFAVLLGSSALLKACSHGREGGREDQLSTRAKVQAWDSEFGK